MSVEGKPSERVLIIDDDEAVRILMTRILGYAGHEVITASDGEEGLQVVAEIDPTLILLDLHLPRMNGLDVLRALQTRNCPAPVILMTFFGSEEVLVEALRLGIRDYLPKPFTPEALTEAMERALATRRWSVQKDRLDRQEAALDVMDQLVAAVTQRINSPLMAMALGLDSLRSQIDSMAEADRPPMQRTLNLLEVKVQEISAVVEFLHQASKMQPASLLKQAREKGVERFLQEGLQ